MEEEKVCCPKCKSTQVTAMKRGFNASKAVAGAVLTGGIGLLAGTHGSNKIQVACLNCGNKWYPADRAKTERRDEDWKRTVTQVNLARENSRWKNKFYSIYESGEIEKAEEHFRSKRPFTKRAPNIHAAYKMYKKEDREKTIISAVLIGLIVLLFIWIAS